jgi:hypothetical protein
MGDDSTTSGAGRARRRMTVATLRNVLIAVPPVAVLVSWIAASIHAHGATGDTDLAWEPIVWPLMSALWTFPFAVGTVVPAVLLRRVPARPHAIVASSVVAALGVLPFVGAVSVVL